MGVISNRGQAILWADGRKLGQAKTDFMQVRPNDGMSLGTDSSSSVGDYPEGFNFKGTATDIRLYWGNWIGRPS